MMKNKPPKSKAGKLPAKPPPLHGYNDILSGVVELLETARRAAARSGNAVMTATYWEIGRRIVEHEQGGKKRTGYGEELLVRLSQDLTTRFGRGFSRQNLQRFREFYLTFPPQRIRSTLSSILPAPLPIPPQTSDTPSHRVVPVRVRDNGTIMRLPSSLITTAPRREGSYDYAVRISS